MFLSCVTCGFTRGLGSISSTLCDLAVSCAGSNFDTDKSMAPSFSDLCAEASARGAALVSYCIRQL